VTLKSGLQVTQDHSNWYHSKARVQFPICLVPSIVTMALSCTYFEILVENRDFFIPPCIRRPRSGCSRRNIAIPFGTEKLEWWGYPTVKNVWGYV